MMKKAYTVSLLLSCLTMGVSRADIDMGKFTDANAKFAQRSEMNYQDLAVNREEYKNIFTSADLNSEEKVFAVTQMARLDVYRAGLLPELVEVDVEEQKRVMEMCLDDIELISSSNSAQYHYFKIACLGFRGKIAGMMGRMKYGLLMRKAQGKALEVAEAGGTFEGGGIYRVMSALRGNRKAKPLGLYNAEEALQYAKNALNTASQNVPPFANQLSGNDYYENHYYLSQSKIGLGLENSDQDLVKEGTEELATTIKKIDVFNRLNRLGERKAETLAYQVLMTKLKDMSESCLTENNWRSCLIEKLSD